MRKSVDDGWWLVDDVVPCLTSTSGYSRTLAIFTEVSASRHC